MKMKLTLVITSLTFILFGCGGGGGGEETPPVTPPVIQPSDLQTTVPTPTYPANSDNLAAFNAINEFRSSLGLGLWAQNTLLDMATQNHLNYAVLHNVLAHDEIPGWAGFTGVNATERAAHEGYFANWVGDVGAPALGAVGVAGLIDTVYHRSALMNQQMTELGIANSLNPLIPFQFISFSNAKGSQHNASDFTAVYPLDGQTNVPLFMMAESVNPFPSIPLPSAPVSFISAAGTKLKVSSFTITPSGSSTPLTTQVLTQDNDPNLIYLPSHEAYVVSVEPFLPNTTYNVNFVGTVNNIIMSKNWNFTTGIN